MTPPRTKTATRLSTFITWIAATAACSSYAAVATRPRKKVGRLTARCVLGSTQHRRSPCVVHLHFPSFAQRSRHRQQ